MPKIEYDGCPSSLVQESSSDEESDNSGYEDSDSDFD